MPAAGSSEKSGERRRTIVGEPLVAQAVRQCYAKQVDTVRQLLADIDEPWARVLAAR